MPPKQLFHASKIGPKTAQEAPKTLQERLPDIGLRSGMGRVEPLGRRGPAGEGGRGEGKTSKETSLGS